MVGKWRKNSDKTKDKYTTLYGAMKNLFSLTLLSFAILRYAVDV